jgi:hypothetical protein
MGVVPTALPRREPSHHTAAPALAAPSTATSQREKPWPSTMTCRAGAARIGAKGSARQTRLKTSEPLVPPKPKLFFSA